MINEDELARKPKRVPFPDDILGTDRCVLKTPAGVSGIFVTTIKNDDGTYILQVNNNMSQHWFEIHMTRETFYCLMGIDPVAIG